MSKIWVNANGLIVDALGVVICDRCPCGDETSSSSSSSSLSGSSSGYDCDCYSSPELQDADGGQCAAPGVACYEITSFPSSICPSNTYTITGVITGSIPGGGPYTSVLTIHGVASIDAVGGSLTLNSTSIASGTATIEFEESAGTFSVTFTTAAFSPPTTVGVVIIEWRALEHDGGRTVSYSASCIETSCCPGVQVPATLNVTITGGSCPGTYQIAWDGSAWRDP
ncbi:MAG: hypothetical protein R3C03_24180 [Pirellulaceae bacterium]